MPTEKPPIRSFLTRRDLHNGVRCPRPEVRIPVGVANRPIPLDVPFVVDTGADVTLIPITFARAYNLVGYDRGRSIERFQVSFGGFLEGCWGKVRIFVGAKQTDLNCFYYLTSTTSGKALWFDRIAKLLPTLRPGRRPKDSPIVLGRADFILTHCLVIQDGWVVISDRPLLELPK
jgi:hypothetical protein